MPVREADRSVEERLDQIEAFLAELITKARGHPVGRKILAYLGLS